jgi:hypothetical protein
VDDWASMSSSGVAVPEEIMQLHAMLQAIPQRRNQDTRAPNALGRKLLEICRMHGLLIMNGRLVGDEAGSYTFHADGREGRSLIDYVIASPELCFGEDGQADKGSYMHVWSREACPARTDGGNFDHVPLLIAIGLSRVDPCPQGHRQGRQQEGKVCDCFGESFRWRDDIQPIYASILQSDPTVTGLLRRVCDNDTCLMEKEHAFMQALKQALLDVDARVGRVRVLGKKSGDPCTAPQNGWYTEACREARQRVRATEAVYGCGSAEAIAMHREYRRVTRAARKAHELAEQKRLHEALYRDPKAFWKAYGGGGKRTALSDVGAWTKYFSDLLELEDGDPQVHASREDISQLFPHPNPALVEEVYGVLNRPISAGEVHDALECMKRGKAAGVDGIPAEFLRYACVRVEGEAGTVHYNILCHPLAVLFNSVISEGYPSTWAAGAVAPVPKPQSR